MVILFTHTKATTQREHVLTWRRVSYPALAQVKIWGSPRCDNDKVVRLTCVETLEGYFVSEDKSDGQGLIIRNIMVRAHVLCRYGCKYCTLSTKLTRDYAEPCVTEKEWASWPG